MGLEMVGDHLATSSKVVCNSLTTHWAVVKLRKSPTSLSNFLLESAGCSAEVELLL